VLVAERLASRGRATGTVSAQPNRRRIALVPEAEWPDPPIGPVPELLTAGTPRSRGGLSSVVSLARLACTEAGLAEPRITSDATHIEIALTDKADSMRLLLEKFADRGIGPGLTLVVGGNLGRRDGVLGGDAFVLPAPAPGITTALEEPTGVPLGVRYLPGGMGAFRATLDEQLRRRARRRVPWIDEDPEWVLSISGAEARRARMQETLLSLGDGEISLRGSHEQPDPPELPLLLAAGVYTGQGPTQHLLEGPWPLSVNVTAAREQERRLLDLHTGVLVREGAGGGDGVLTMRFVGAGHRGVVAQRVEGPTGRVCPDRLPGPSCEAPQV